MSHTIAALRVLTRQESPFPGALLAADPDRPEEGPLVWTDSVEWRDNPAWRARPDGHILAPVDVARRGDARGVLVPHCPARVREWVLARTAIAAGEAVTVAVSLVRGAVEAEVLEVENGVWWLTASGRPVLAVGGSSPWRGDAVAVMDAIVARCRDRREALSDALRAVRDAVAGERIASAAEPLEEAMFAAAPPGPLILEITGSVPSERRIVLEPGGEPADDGTALRARRGRTGRAGSIAQLIRHHVDDAWADRIRDALSGAAGAFRRPHDGEGSAARPGRRRAPVLSGAAVAAVVLAGGLLWPADDEVSRADPGSPTTAATRAAVPTASRTPVPGGESLPRRPRRETGGEGDTIVASGASLVERLAACAAEGCGPDVVEQSERVLPPGAATDPSVDRRVVLVDEYGGVAVLRVGDAAGETGDQIVVIVRTDDEWLVRDVYDAEDQP